MNFYDLDLPAELLPQDLTALGAIEFCLQQLDQDASYEMRDEIVARLTFEEVIGALLLARDALREVQTEETL